MNQALAFEHFEDATDIQTTLTTVLEAARFSPHLTLDIARRVTGTIKGFSGELGPRNRGDVALAEIYQRLQRICIDFCERDDAAIQ